ncbi:hypothetical protein NDU88_000548 [Pleurodeles waltl]|uniref:Uncharacterized protein n=1 Tax=Pleurodeles waltl TaxID=8319 RepID=A0AAV7URE2_PLEWA|nr:hypothetical protein NDU88_000548 [Pleurodeles waltl]
MPPRQIRCSPGLLQLTAAAAMPHFTLRSAPPCSCVLLLLAPQGQGTVVQPHDTTAEPPDPRPPGAQTLQPSGPAPKASIRSDQAPTRLRPGFDQPRSALTRTRTAQHRVPGPRTTDLPGRRAAGPGCLAAELPAPARLRRSCRRLRKTLCEPARAVALRL